MGGIEVPATLESNQANRHEGSLTTIAAEGLPLDATLAGSVAADPQALARLILELHADPARNAALSRAGRAALRQHFSQKQLDGAL